MVISRKLRAWQGLRTRQSLAYSIRRISEIGDLKFDVVLGGTHAWAIVLADTINNCVSGTVVSGTIGRTTSRWYYDG